MFLTQRREWSPVTMEKTSSSWSVVRTHTFYPDGLSIVLSVSLHVEFSCTARFWSDLHWESSVWKDWRNHLQRRTTCQPADQHTVFTDGHPGGPLTEVLSQCLFDKDRLGFRGTLLKSTLQYQCAFLKPIFLMFTVNSANVCFKCQALHACWHRVWLNPSHNSSYLLISPRCNGKQVCEVNTEVFRTSDPCVGIYKYLETTYTCSPASQSVSMYNNTKYYTRLMFAMKMYVFYLCLPSSGQCGV